MHMCVYGRACVCVRVYAFMCVYVMFLWGKYIRGCVDSSNLSQTMCPNHQYISSYISSISFSCTNLWVASCSAETI